ncbi:MAG: type I-U CRISPR-associated protein Csb2 [Chloroflexota bacterium]|nr:type I-U CRISPR-associated protein Csb2 [Chloroflexota bacterium]
MITLQFQFTHGRYHATEWGRNANEGAPDWPPSMWRILRALISSWYVYHASLPEAEVWPVLRELSSGRASYRLPPSNLAHTRHYVPLPQPENHATKTAKMIDAFVLMDVGANLHIMIDDAVLTNRQADVLRMLLNSVRYLGRAESECTARLYTGAECSPVKPNCIRLDDCPGGIAPAGWRIVNVLVPARDVTLLDLKSTTAYIRSHDKTIWPHGATRIKYALDASDQHAYGHRRPPQKRPDTTTVMYAIAGSVTPPITDTITTADAFKRAVMSAHGARGNRLSTTLSGMTTEHGADNSNSNVSRDNHAHAYFLPTDENGDRRLDRLTVFSRVPFTPDELAALASVRLIRPHGKEPLKLIPVYRGNAPDAGINILGVSRTWESVTPFVPNLHSKIRGPKNNRYLADGPADQIASEASKRGLPSMRRVVLSSEKIHGFRPAKFAKNRKRGLAGFGAYRALVEFERPVPGPVSFGHGSHFGLGLFHPVHGKREGRNDS